MKHSDDRTSRHRRARRSPLGRRRCARRRPAPATQDDRIVRIDAARRPQAGGHPDLDHVVQPRRPRATRRRPRTSSSTLRRESSATRTRSTSCTSVDFALDAVPAELAGGSDHDPRQLRRQPELPARNRADLRPGARARRDRRCFALRRADPQHPDHDPGHGAHRRPTTACASRSPNITQLTPLAEADLTFWGFPALAEPRRAALPERLTRRTRRLPGPRRHRAASTRRPPPAITGPPADRQPDHLHRGAAADRRWRSRPTRTPSTSRTPTATYPRDHGLRERDLQPGPLRRADDERDRLRLRARPRAQRPRSSLGFAASPSELRSAIVTLPEGLTINPDAADGQTRLHRRPGELRHRGRRRNAPTTPRSAPSRSTPRRSTAPLIGSIYIGEPKPGDQYRLFLIADGFGIHAKLVGSFRPDPATGQLTADFDDLPQVPFDDFDIHLFASDRGLMATPTAARIYEVEARLLPLERRRCPKSALDADLQPQLRARTDAPCPGQVRPFKPRLVAGTSNSGRRRLQRLQPEARPRRRRPVPRRPQLQDAARASPATCAGSPTARRRRSPPPRRTPGAPSRRPRAARPSSQIGTTNVAAGPGAHPFHAVGKMYLAGPVQGGAAQPRRGHPGAGRPLRLRRRRRPGRPPRRPARPPRSAPSPTRCPSIIGGVPIRMRSIQVNIDKPELHDQPDQLLALHGRLPGDRRPGHGHRLLLLLPRGQLRHARLQAEDDGPPDRRPQGHPPRREPGAAVRPAGPARATPTSNRSR